MSPFNRESWKATYLSTMEMSIWEGIPEDVLEMGFQSVPCGREVLAVSRSCDDRLRPIGDFPFNEVRRTRFGRILILLNFRHCFFIRNDIPENPPRLVQQLHAARDRFLPQLVVRRSHHLPDSSCQFHHRRLIDRYIASGYSLSFVPFPFTNARTHRSGHFPAHGILRSLSWR